MAKHYKVYLSDNYVSDEPFTCDWDLGLIGPKIRAEFESYMERMYKQFKEEKRPRARWIPATHLRDFMTLKQVNLVYFEDRARDYRGNKSVFILKLKEELVVDEQGYESLKARYEKRRKEFSRPSTGGGVPGKDYSDWLGFMEFEETDEPLNLYRGYQEQYPEEQEVKEKKEIRKGPAGEDDRTRVYQCPECPKVCTGKLAFKQHLKYKHPDKHDELFGAKK